MSPAVLVPLILVGLGFGVFLLFRSLARGGAKLEAEHSARLGRAARAKATVIAIEKSAAQHKRGTVMMRVRLRVDGAESVGVWEVDLAHVPEVQPDKVLDVRIDAEDPTRCYPGFVGAQHSPLYATMWSDGDDRP